MSETSLKPVIDKLENLFSKFNEKFYGGELQKAIITVSPDNKGCLRMVYRLESLEQSRAEKDF